MFVCQFFWVNVDSFWLWYSYGPGFWFPENKRSFLLDTNPAVLALFSLVVGSTVGSLKEVL